MKIQNYYLAILLCLALFACKKDHSDSSGEGSGEQVFQAFLTLNKVSDRFVEIGDSMQVAPPVALYYASLWASSLPEVKEAYTLDSSFLTIKMKSGYENTITLRELGKNGLSVYRGSGGGTGKLTKITSSSGGNCSNKITNKKVLLYSAYMDQFFLPGEYQTRVIDKIKNGDVGDIDVTVLKNGECTIDVLRTLDQYGLVILDTHGERSGIITGIMFDLIESEIPASVDEYLTLIGQKIGPNNIPALIDSQVEIGYCFQYSPDLQIKAQWDNYKAGLARQYQVTVKSKGIRKIVPDLSHTIIFANACFSGWTATEYVLTTKRLIKGVDAVRLAWASRNPLVYYGYEAANDGVSYKAPNDEFCKPNEDTLIKSLFYDGDSTGHANLADLLGGSLVLEIPWSHDIGPLNDHGPLRFNQYGSPSWCYGHCGDTLLDDRDGQKYPTVCIGDQIWMAKNLNYASAGICFDNDPNACNTYGRLYTWQEVTAGVASNTSPSGVKGICPKGWHVPSLAEWQKLITNVGGENAAKSKLRAKSSLWEDGPGTDDFGFALLPSGQCETLPSYDCFNLGGEANIWTSSKEASIPNRPIYYFISEGQVAYFPQDDNVTANLSCRCVKD